MTTAKNINVRQRLKIETALSHQRLDDTMSSLGPFDSIANYGWYLIGMDALYCHCQPSIRWAEQEAGLAIHKPSLRQLIEADLRTLGENYATNQPQDAENSQKFDIATCWAQAYVMEGSAIGASFMIRSAKQKLDSNVGLTFMPFGTPHQTNRQLSTDCCDRKDTGSIKIKSELCVCRQCSK